MTEVKAQFIQVDVLHTCCNPPIGVSLKFLSSVKKGMLQNMVFEQQLNGRYLGRMLGIWHKWD
jgi:hypothetical protein